MRDRVYARCFANHQPKGRERWAPHERICPDCESQSVVDLADILASPRVDYFRCCDCLCWWLVPKGEDEPATRAVFGNLNAVAVKNKAG